MTGTLIHLEYPFFYMRGGKDGFPNSGLRWFDLEYFA